MVGGIGGVGGLYGGFAANRPGPVAAPARPGDVRPAGVLYREGIAKVSAFSRACNDDGIPLVWLQDIGGFDIGVEAERQGLLAYGSSLIYANSTNTVPMFTVLLRKASGAGYYAMAGLPYDPIVQLSTCLSRLGVMEGRTLAIAAYNSKLDDDFRIVTEDPSERAAIERGMKEVEQRIERDMDPFVAARQMDTDEIVALADLRAWLVALVEMSWQGTGYRRTKNPRIWSLHDLDVLAERGAAPASSPAEVRATTATAPSAIADGATVVRAPMSGRFYARPTPADPPFVSVGDVLSLQKTVGLLEVMKTFHRIHYGGTGLPERARVVRILANDGDDLRTGDAIVEVEDAP
jgi:biotin carboxyl carrier protein